MSEPTSLSISLCVQLPFDRLLLLSSQGDVFTLDEQIQNLKITLQQLHLLLGNGTADFLARSLFFVGMGANDYINNYLHPLPRKSRKYTAVAFSQLLIQEYRRQLEVISPPPCFNEHFQLKQMDCSCVDRHRIYMTWAQEKFSSLEFHHSVVLQTRQAAPMTAEESASDRAIHWRCSSIPRLNCWSIS